MQQLTGLDQMFLGLDTETTNGVLGGLVLFDAPQPGAPLPDEAFLRARITERLDYLPPLRRRVRSVPLGLDHPFLVETDRVDVSAHLRTIRLAAPGTPEQLAAEVSRLMGSVRLPADRPLWDMHVIEGLQDGGVAHLLRIHHVVIDGSSMPTLWDLLSDEPRSELFAAPVTHPWPEPAGGNLEMLLRGAVGLLRKPVDALTVQARFISWAASRTVPERGLTVPAVAAKMLPAPLATPVTELLSRGLEAVGASPARPYLPTVLPPATDFNGRVTARRSYHFAELPLADLKAVGKAFGVTLNDVVVAITAGAVRRHLMAHGGEVDRPLVVCVPVSLRQGDEQPRWANWVHMIFAPLPTHLADPARRVRQVSADLRAVKASFDAMPLHLMRPASRLMPPPFMSLMSRAMVKLPGPLSRVPWNVVVSNVKGPSAAVFENGLRVRGYWPASFLSIGGGINVTLQSYVDTVCFGFMVCPDQVPDPSVLVEGMAVGLTELQQAAGLSRPGPVPVGPAAAREVRVASATAQRPRVQAAP